MNNDDKEIVYQILKDVGFHNTRHSQGQKSFRHKDAMYNLPNVIDKIRNPPLPSIENISDSDLEGQGLKIIIPSNILDIYTRLEILLGLKLSGHTDTLTEASILIDELYKGGEIQNKQQYRNALNKFSSFSIELPGNLVEQIAINSRPKIEEHILIIMYKSTHEEHLFQPLQTNIKQFKIAVTFLAAYNGIFNVTNKNKFHFKKQLIEEDFIQITIPPGAYEIETLNKELKRIIIDKDYYSENDYPFTIKPNFSTLGSIIQTKPQGSIIGFVFDDTIGNLLGFNETILYEEYNISPNPVDNLSFDNIFIHTDIAQGMIFKGKRSGIIHNFTMDVDPR